MANGDKGGSAPNLTLIEGALEGARPAPEVGRKKKRSSEGTDRWVSDEPEIPFLPAGCPIEPLGKLGMIHYFLDEQRQLIALEPREINKGNIIALMGRKAKLVHEFWPRYSDKTGTDGKPIVTGWKPEVAGELLMNACAMEGLFNLQGKVRGSGAHRSADGSLVLHCGDKIYMTGTVAGYVDPGKIAGFVYPAGSALPRLDPLEQGTDVGEIILMKLRAWNWQRPKIDPMLLLGHIGCAMVGGALRWRPHAWITGGTATGKSTLQTLLREIQDGAALSTGQATEAGIRQLLAQQTLPVFFDELEPDADNRRQAQVVGLARIASSGDQILKGGQNHQGAEFKVQSCFLFSSILLPPMPTQDKNRLAVLELDPLEDLIVNGKIPQAPKIDEEELHQLGRRIRRRLADHWHRVDTLVDRYKNALGSRGHSGRSGDQFGTLLAIADIMLYDAPTDAEGQAAADETILFWADLLDARTLSEKVTEVADEEAVIKHLTTSMIKGRGGDEPEPIIRAIRAALEPDGEKARERLENIGLRIVERTPTGAKSPSGNVGRLDLYLAIANQHVMLAAIFDGTQWNSGTWAQSFGRVRFKIAGAEGEPPIIKKAERRVRVRYGPGKPDWSTLVPLPSVLELNPVD